MLHHKKIVPFTLALLASVGVLAEPIRASQDQIILLAQQTATESSFPLLDKLPQGSTVKISGSENVEKISNSLKDKFEATYPGSAVEVNSTTSDAALTAVKNNNVDLAAISRPLTDTEKAQGLKTVTLNREKIAIIVGADNPYNGNLTIDQFAKIFRGEITDWSEIGGASGAIRVIDRLDTNDTRRSFPNYPVFKNAPFRAGGNAIVPSQDNITAVVQELGKDGIGYAPVSVVKDLSGIKIVTMHKTLPDDPRYPFSQPNLYVYQGELSPAAQGYLGFATADVGKQVIAGTLGNNASPSEVATPKTQISEAQTRDPRFKVDPPEVKIPKSDFKVDAPEAKVPDVEVKTPEINAPEVKAPEVNAKVPDVDLKTPEVKAPEINAPEVNAPEVKAPEVNAQVPDVDLKTPEVEVPDLKAPDIIAKAPDVDLKATNADVKTPGVKAPSVDSPNIDANAPNVGVNTPEVTAQAPDVNLNTPDAAIQAPRAKWLWWLPLLGIIPLIGFLVKNGKGREANTVATSVRERELVGAGVGSGRTTIADRNLERNNLDIDNGTNFAAGATMAGLGGAAIAGRRRKSDLPDTPDLNLNKNINTPNLPKFGDTGADINLDLDRGKIELDTPDLDLPNIDTPDLPDVGEVRTNLGGAVNGFQSKIGDLDTPELNTPDLDLPNIDTPELPDVGEVRTNLGGAVNGFQSKIGDLDTPELNTPDLDLPKVDDLKTNVGGAVNGIRGKIGDLTTNGSEVDLPELNNLDADLDNLDLPELNDANADPNNFDLLNLDDLDLDRSVANSQDLDLLDLDDLTDNSHDLDLPDLDLANDDLRGLRNQVPNNLNDLDNLINSKPEHPQKDNFFESLQEKANRAINEATNTASEFKDNLWDDSDR